MTDRVKVHNLQEAIEREIRDHVMSLRSRFITRWNNNCGRTLHKMLIRYLAASLKCGLCSKDNDSSPGK